MGGVNTADIIVSFLALYLIESSRSGASVALQALSEIDVQTTVFLGSTSLFAVGLSAVIALKISGKVLNTLSGLDMRPVLIAVTGVIVGITIYLTGFLGLLVLLTSSCIGYAAVIKSERVSCMAVLLVPAILFYTSFLSV
jgi:TctA family transporter